MTGYGKAEAAISTGKVTVEIRTLNAKNAEVNVKSSLLPREKELAVRKKLADSLIRGTIDLFISFEPAAGSGSMPDTKLLASYLDELRKAIHSGIPSPESDAVLLSAIMRLPEFTSIKKTDTIPAEEWPVVEKAIDEALAATEAYRIREGEALHADVTERIRNILSLYDEVEKIDPERIAVIREKLIKALAELGQKPDQSRFEQELIYYLEKYDINEEKVRLRQHCRYFLETLDGDPCPGKKLGFIVQEMGREINTTGSKANNADIQKLVVRMKDELEKIREQSMNIL